LADGRLKFQDRRYMNPMKRAEIIENEKIIPNDDDV